MQALQAFEEFVMPSSVYNNIGYRFTCYTLWVVYLDDFRVFAYAYWNQMAGFYQSGVSWEGGGMFKYNPSSNHVTKFHPSTVTAVEK